MTCIGPISPAQTLFLQIGKDVCSHAKIILNSQQEKLDEGAGADKVDQFLIIFDDVIGNVQFMNDTNFTRCFYQVRHVNCTTFICTQHYKRVPKVCRMQANFTFFFQGSQSEVEVVTEEFAPPEYSKQEFAQLVNNASKQPYTFLTINMKVGWDRRFRKGLDEFIVLDRLTGDDSGDSDDDSGEEGDDEGSDSEEEKGYEGEEKQQHEELVESASALTESDRQQGYNGSNE